MRPTLTPSSRSLAPPSGALATARLAPGIEVQEILSPLTEAAWHVSSDSCLGTADAFVLMAGTGTVEMGAAVATVAGPCVIWLPAGSSGRVLLRAGCRGARLRVSEATLGRVVPLVGLSNTLRAALDRPLLGARLEPAAAQRLAADFAGIERELAADLAGGRAACFARLQLVLIAFWRLAETEPAAPAATPRLLVQNFLQLLELHVRQHWKVTDYARTMGISTDRLASAIRRATGVSPHELVQRRLTDDAQQLLERSALQVGEIALTLGFKDAGYFNRFFSRRAGLPPGRYRASTARGRRTADGSFAAWP